MGNFQPLEVVDRGSETQPQVVEKLNKLTERDGVNVGETRQTRDGLRETTVHQGYLQKPWTEAWNGFS